MTSQRNWILGAALLLALGLSVPAWAQSDFLPDPLMQAQPIEVGDWYGSPEASGGVRFHDPYSSRVYNFNPLDPFSVLRYEDRRRQQVQQYEDDLASSLRRGDLISVTGTSTRLMSGENSIANLRSGEELVVKKVSGPWILTEAHRGGRNFSGWVRSSEVQFLEAAPPEAQQQQQQGTTGPQPRKMHIYEWQSGARR